MTLYRVQKRPLEKPDWKIIHTGDSLDAALDAFLDETVARGSGVTILERELDDGSWHTVPLEDIGGSLRSLWTHKGQKR